MIIQLPFTGFSDNGYFEANIAHLELEIDYTDLHLKYVKHYINEVSFHLGVELKFIKLVYKAYEDLLYVYAPLGTDLSGLDLKSIECYMDFDFYKFI